ncbi:hypothetical protein [Nocardia farcinica]|uniref:hypothetical protein n=1 Tax=Nocardia farcinica TaxID=37329 RepID=UPI002455BB09|nr:hypothetical protein [Nocardia farcinica]
MPAKHAHLSAPPSFATTAFRRTDFRSALGGLLGAIRQVHRRFRGQALTDQRQHASTLEALEHPEQRVPPATATAAPLNASPHRRAGLH